MPMRAYRSTMAAYGRGAGHVGRNVTGNLGLWIALFTAIALAAALLNWLAAGRASNWGHLAAVAGMMVGILVMMKAQEGYVPPEMPDEDEDPPPA